MFLLISILMKLVFITKANHCNSIGVSFENVVNWIRNYCHSVLPPDILFGLFIADEIVLNASRSLPLHHNNLNFCNNVYTTIVFNKIQMQGLRIRRQFLHDMLPTKKVKIDTLEKYLENIDDGVPDQEQSDICMAQIFSTNSCGLSSECLQVFSMKNQSKGYHKTHQVLIAMLIQQNYCRFRLPFNLSLRVILVKLCQSVLSESISIAALKYPPLLTDLFLEEALFCSLAGFDEFFDGSIIDLILSWQTREGCFADDSKICSDHMTGLGVAYLSQFGETNYYL